jgi:hypothetical protein
MENSSQNLFGATVLLRRDLDVRGSPVRSRASELVVLERAEKEDRHIYLSALSI